MSNREWLSLYAVLTLGLLIYSLGMGQSNPVFILVGLALVGAFIYRSTERR